MKVVADNRLPDLCRDLPPADHGPGRHPSRLFSVPGGRNRGLVGRICGRKRSEISAGPVGNDRGRSACWSKMAIFPTRTRGGHRRSEGLVKSSRGWRFRNRPRTISTAGTDKSHRSRGQFRPAPGIFDRPSAHQAPEIANSVSRSTSRRRGRLPRPQIAQEPVQKGPVLVFSSRLLNSGF
jgi:hypothetical protein